MGERRMFSKTIIDSDNFLDMPLSSQLLYFHLSMRADDDGFINNPKSIMRNVRCNDDDLKLLIAKQFILPFESGVVVIKHWKIHNYIRADRYKETNCLEEKKFLQLNKGNEYVIGIPSDNQVTTIPQPSGNQVTTIPQPSGNQVTTIPQPSDNQVVDNRYTQVKLSKVKLSKVKLSKVKEDHKGPINKINYAEFVSMTNEEHQRLIDKYGDDKTNAMVDILDNYKGSKGTSYKNDYRAILSWVVKRYEDDTSINKMATKKSANQRVADGISAMELARELERKRDKNG
ncbi:MAG: hypothetical protein WCR45_02960 [Bacteroidaceae bacterium]|nr:replisome organizer [Bacteroidaceae bacterium]